jgi:hypothetical protein
MTPGLNTAAFVPRKRKQLASRPLSATDQSTSTASTSTIYRTLPYTMSWVRADGYNNLDASILKNFNFTEGAYLQLRFETFNTLNHPVFAPANTSSATSTQLRLQHNRNHHHREQPLATGAVGSEDRLLTVLHRHHHPASGPVPDALFNRST